MLGASLEPTSLWRASSLVSVSRLTRRVSREGLLLDSGDGVATVASFRGLLPENVTLVRGADVEGPRCAHPFRFLLVRRASKEADDVSSPLSRDADQR